MDNNAPLSRKIEKEFNPKLYLDLLTHFIYNIQNKLDIGLSENDKHSYIPIEQLSIKHLRQRLELIEEKIDSLVELQTKNSVNDLLLKIKEDNAVLEREIDELTEKNMKENKK